jgi:MGT family glycosyltransferase
VNPALSVASELQKRGHQVAWAGHRSVVGRLLEPAATLFEIDDRLDNEFFQEKLAEANRVRGLESFRFVYKDFFLPLARAMAPGVESAADRFQPDVLVADQQALAGMVVARRRAIPWATSSTTAAAVVDPFVDLPKVSAWRRQQFRDLLKEHGIQPPADSPCDLSPFLVLVFSVPALTGSAKTFPAHMKFVGPAINCRPRDVGFPWDWLKKQTRILVTLGTINAERGREFFQAAATAFSETEYQVILVAPEGAVSVASSNVLVCPRVPQLQLLEHVHAVVCHAGQNTVIEALSNGLPLVVAPIKDDQTVIAQQVADAGAGIRIRFRRTSPETLRKSVDRLLSEPSYRHAAQHIKEALREAGGAPAAAGLLEGLL